MHLMAKLPGQSTRAQFRQMLESLLGERFKLGLDFQEQEKRRLS